MLHQASQQLLRAPSCDASSYWLITPQIERILRYPKQNPDKLTQPLSRGKEIAERYLVLLDEFRSPSKRHRTNQPSVAKINGCGELSGEECNTSVIPRSWAISSSTALWLACSVQNLFTADPISYKLDCYIASNQQYQPFVVVVYATRHKCTLTVRERVPSRMGLCPAPNSFILWRDVFLE